MTFRNAPCHTTSRFGEEYGAGLAAAQIMLSLLVSGFAPTGLIVPGLDDTIERRRGEKIKAKGIYSDPVRSSHSHFFKASGLRWLSLMLLCEIPWAGRAWALPFLIALCPSERYCTERGRAPRKLTERARQLLLLAGRWLPGREIAVTADGSFAALELLEAVRASVAVGHACAWTPLCMSLRLRGRPDRRGDRARRGGG